LKKKDDKLQGGSNGRRIPMYAEPVNSPFVPQEQKNIMMERYNETHHGHHGHDTQKNRVKQPLVDLQVYETEKNTQKKPTIEPALYAPIGVPYPYNAMPQYMNYPNTYPYQYVPNNNIPLLKNYNINISGPSVDHGKVSTIFEDILPKAQFNNMPNTLGERLNILNFIRSVFIKQNDGEDIDINGKTDNSLLSYLKFMELNPYNKNHFSKNPYKGLPDDMLIYRSCYPIRYDKNTGLVQCAKNSIGITIRIYRLTNEEYDIRKKNSIEYQDYDSWREIMYYEYIREKILKEYICPHFVSMYTYYICEKSDIDFDKILIIKGKYRNTNIKNTISNIVQHQVNVWGGNKTYKNVKMREYPKYKELNLGDNYIGPDHINPDHINPDHINPDYINQDYIGDKYKHVIPRQSSNKKRIIKQNEVNPPFLEQPIVIDDKKYVGKTIVSLTEAPTYNLYAWASKTYKVTGNVQKMINTGFHKSCVWESIIMQLMISLYVLQLHNIAFENFDIESNVFIKDISAHTNTSKYWKYKIDGFEYYIPNYGYLLQIDSNYGDIDNEYVLLSQKTKKYKIYSENIYGKHNGKFTEHDDIKKECFNIFKKIINPNIFSMNFLQIGGTKPNDDIINLLLKINNDAITNNNIDIEHYIRTHMSKFLNNRIGTFVKENEFNNIRSGIPREFKRGQIIAYLIEYNTYKFALYLSEDSTSTGKTLIVYKDNINNLNMEIISVPSGNLFYYSDYNIVQNYKAGEVIFSSESLLETYVINK
jgi:hypothetical protein